jgi:hypothetical protein
MVFDTFPKLNVEGSIRSSHQLASEETTTKNGTKKNNNKRKSTSFIEDNNGHRISYLLALLVGVQFRAHVPLA